MQQDEDFWQLVYTTFKQIEQVGMTAKTDQRRQSRADLAEKTDAAICRWDLAVKILVPVGLALCLALSWQVGSWEAWWRLFQARTYTAGLTGVVAGLHLADVVVPGGRTILWARYRPVGSAKRGSAEPDGGDSGL